MRPAEDIGVEVRTEKPLVVCKNVDSEPVVTQMMMEESRGELRPSLN